jgi:hypothetical protein
VLNGCARCPTDALRACAGGVLTRPLPFVRQAIAIETDIRTSGISLSELEYALLVAAMTGCVWRDELSRCRNLVLICWCRSASVSAAETEAWALLRRMKEDLRLVSADLLQAIRAWFAALGPEWQVDSTTVSDEGVNAHDASIQLQPVRSHATLRAIQRKAHADS